LAQLLGAPLCPPQAQDRHSLQVSHKIEDELSLADEQVQTEADTHNSTSATAIPTPTDVTSQTSMSPSMTSRPYGQQLMCEVVALCDPSSGPERHLRCVRINKLLYAWDERIQDALQDQPAAVSTAYLVGRSLAALRWYFATDHTPTAPPISQTQMAGAS